MKVLTIHGTQITSNNMFCPTVIDIFHVPHWCKKVGRLHKWKLHSMMVTMSRLHHDFQWTIFPFTHAHTVKLYKIKKHNVNNINGHAITATIKHHTHTHCMHTRMHTHTHTHTYTACTHTHKDHAFIYAHIHTHIHLHYYDTRNMLIHTPVYIYIYMRVSIILATTIPPTLR